MAAATTDPRLARCGYAKLTGERGWEHFLRKPAVVLGRAAAKSTVDVQLDDGGTKVLSRRHCTIRWNAPSSTWELATLGKNAVHVNGAEAPSARVSLGGGDEGAGVRLASGDELRLAGSAVTLRFWLPAADVGVLAAEGMVGGAKKKG